jgi:hypothetical protein
MFHGTKIGRETWRRGEQGQPNARNRAAQAH